MSQQVQCVLHDKGTGGPNLAISIANRQLEGTGFRLALATIKNPAAIAGLVAAVRELVRCSENEWDSQRHRWVGTGPGSYWRGALIEARQALAALDQEPEGQP